MGALRLGQLQMTGCFRPPLNHSFSADRIVHGLCDGAMSDQLGGAASERSDPPLLNVRSHVREGGLVGAEEIAQAEVHDSHWRGRPCVTCRPRQLNGAVGVSADRQAHSLNTLRG